MKHQPVTVLTPSIPDRPEMLAEAMASVAAQTFKPIAHLVAIDYRYKGPATMLNRLCEAAKTEWLAILADDDLYDPDHLETVMAEVRDADIVLSWGKLTGKDEEQFRGEFDPEDLVQRKDTGMRGNFLFRKSLWERLRFDELGLCEDWNFLVRAYQSGARLKPVYRETWTYRFHYGPNGNTSNIIAAAIAKEPLPENLYHVKAYL